MNIVSRNGDQYTSSSEYDIESLRMKMAFVMVSNFKINLTIVATEQNNGTTVTCRIFGIQNEQSNPAILIVQGIVILI